MNTSQLLLLIIFFISGILISTRQKDNFFLSQYGDVKYCACNRPVNKKDYPVP